MTIHDLKTTSPYFQEVKSGRKNFEIRSNDRNFQVGDTLKLREYFPSDNWHSGDVLEREVIYIMRGPVFGLAEGWCILGLKA